MIARRALLLYVRKHHGRALAGLFALMLAAALAEGAGLLLLVPIVTSIGNDPPAWLPPLPSLSILFALFVLLMIVRAALLYWRDVEQSRVDQHIIARMKGDAASSLAARGWGFASNIGQAEMQRIWNSDIARAGMALIQAMNGAVAACFLAIQAIVALVLSWKLALLAAVLLVVSLGLGWPFVRQAQDRGNAIMTAIDQVNETGFSLHAGLKSALAEGRVAAFLERYRDRLSTEVQSFVAFDRSRASARFVTSVMAAVALSAIGWAGIEWLEIAPSLLVLMIVIFARMIGPARSLSEALQGYLAYAPAFAPVSRLLVDAPVIPTSETESRPSWHRIEARGLYVGPGDAPIGPFRFTIERGDWLALTGPSGSGKSLLIDTLAGLLPPAAGDIRLDDRPVALGTRADWAANLAYVGQGDGLIGPNVEAMLGLEPGERPPSLDPIMDIVGLGPLLDRLPQGLESTLGDRGARMSGGERQRVALARALLRDPGLLILDEATVALDLRSEARFLSRLRRERSGLTLVFVSHRPESLDRFDARIEMPENQAAHSTQH